MDARVPRRASASPKGYGVLLADSAASAMELVDRSAPDIAILDVRMPERGGLELLKICGHCRPISGCS
jgi:Response regulator containing CheY-like receiver, AAA-type ATPase, and DNA-binding domains